ncbi:hypothetical protein AAG906_034583 [Vitis piasezkii]
MAHNPSSSDLTGPCKKIFEAITGTTALRAMRRVSLRSQPPRSNIPATSKLPKYDPSAKALISLQLQPPKPDISTESPLSISISGPSAKSHPGPENWEAAEVLPIMFVPADEKKKSKVEMAGQAAKAKPHTESALEKLKSKADMARLEKLTPWPGNPQVANVAQKTEREVHVSVQEKLKPGVEMPTSNKTTTKVEAAAPQVSLQDKPKPQVELQPKPVVEQGQKEEGNMTGHHNIDQRSSDYIKRTTIKIRTTSDVGKSNLEADSSNTKMKAKTTSNVGGGKSASFKK